MAGERFLSLDKRPDLTQRPSGTGTAELPAGADQWVHGGAPSGNDAPRPPAPPAKPAREATRRLTLDIPASLHFAMKMRATATGVAMVDEVGFEGPP